MNNRRRLTNAHILAIHRVEYKSILRIIEKEEWTFHKGDMDAAYGIPHGHLYTQVKGRNAEFKMELWTGNIYDADSKRLSGQVKINEMRILFCDKKFREFIKEARRAYKDRYPSVYLKPLIVNPELRKAMHTRRFTILRNSIRSNSEMPKLVFTCNLETNWF